ncbi:Sc6p-like and SM domain-containing protein [Cryptosporidium canis]|uniref:Sc6p-like and SM domain-containing protein n=1 Tax=Cryptosporidium canis TaxID=195482 RepID=A0ABQ8PBS2_9CRYT|nr:Sc6p-like and SM domain-containing protein [Cryptosporidium canis]KAJ1615396.1 Sc6p-like and SM domain-containing protein [Cryptosporidium canis]
MVHEYIGSKITIISRNDKRYEGILHSIDVDKSTITLKDVRYFENGPDGTPGPASSTVFEMIVFRGSDITDLAVCQPAVSTNHEIPDDPAILSVNGGSEAGPGHSHEAGDRGAPHEQQRPVEAVSEHPKSSPKMSYSSVASGGKSGSGNNQQQKGSKDQPRNRQRNGGGGYSGRSGRGGSHHNGGGHQRSFVVGELKPRINQALKAELETEFDFSEQNKKFEKTFNEGLSSVHAEQGIKLGGSGHDQGGQVGIMGKHTGTGGEFGANGQPIEDQANKLTVGGYNKVSGFFDSISCETLDPERSKKSQGPSDPQAKAMREKQKMIDKETFGASAMRSRIGAYNRGSNNRRGGGGHRGGYHSNNRFNKREA